MRRVRRCRLWALLLLALSTLPFCDRVQAQNVEGQIVAAQFGEFQVPAMGDGFKFPPATCHVSGGGRNFNAFAMGAPIKIVDSDPSLTEIATPVAVFIDSCAVSLPTIYSHESFYLTSGTGGLQEALTNGIDRGGGPNTIILNAEWYTLVAPSSPSAVIASVHGNTNLGLVDVTTTPYTSYAWNGSQYVQNATGGGASTPATSNVLKGAGVANSVAAATPGTDYVIPSGNVATATALAGASAIPNGSTATTQGSGDNTAKIATDLFVLNNALTASSIPATSDLLKGSGTAGSASVATPNTDYLTPSYWGGLTGCGTAGYAFSPQAGGCIASGGASTPATNLVLKGSGSANGVVAATAGTDYLDPALTTLQTLSGPLAVKAINGISHSELYTGATVDVRVNACLSDALNGTNGNTSLLCDSSGESGNQTIAATIVIGDNNNDKVGLILPCGVYWTGSMTNTTPVVEQYAGTTVTSNCASNGPQMQFTTNSSSNPSVIYEIVSGTSLNYPYVYDHGFQITNDGGGGHATSTGVGFLLTGQIADASVLDAVNVFDNLDAYPAEIYGACCQTTWTHSSINAGFYGTPLLIQTDSGNFTRDFTFSNGTIVHPGAGNSAVFCNDTRNSTVSSFALDHVYTETGESSNPAAIYLINGCTRASISHITLPQYGHAGFPAVSITSAYNTMAVVDDIWFTYGSGPWTYPNPAVVNAYTGQSVNSDSNGYFAHYNTPTATTTLGDSTTLGDLAYAGASGVAARLPGNAAATDEVLVSHGSGAISTPTTKTCAHFTTSGTTSTCTWSTAPAIGEFVAIGVYNYTGGATLSVTDSASNVYTAVAASYNPPDIVGQTQLFYFGPLASSITTTTVTSSSSSSGLVILGDTATGIASSYPVDGAPCYADTIAVTSSPCSTAITTTSANDYLFCAAQNETGADDFTAGAGFTAGAAAGGANSLAQYKVQSAVGAITPAITSSSASPMTMTCAAFKPALSTNAPTLSNSPALNTANMFAGGTTFTASGCNNSTLVGGATAGSYDSGTSGTCTVVLTTGVTAPHGYACTANDLTTTADTIKQTASSQTTATLSGTTASGDVISFACTPY
jgi:hypothetical protein